MSFYKLKHVSYLGLVVGLFLIGFPRYIDAQSENKKLLHNGIEREYFSHLPENYDAKKKLPLVLAFHGAGDMAYMFMYYSEFNKVADDHDFIVVYPQGTEHNGRTGWNVRQRDGDGVADDVGFIKNLIEELSQIYKIDSQRVYAAGMSNGGYMSFLLACEMPDMFAAIASVTGSMTHEMKNKCEIEQKIPILQMHGTSDKVIPYNGHPKWSLSMDELISFWTKVNGLNSEPKRKRMPDRDRNDGSQVERLVYRSKKNKIEVVHYKVINGGHDWFGTRGNKDVHASEIIWDFFSEYSLIEKEK